MRIFGRAFATGVGACLLGILLVLASAPLNASDCVGKVSTPGLDARSVRSGAIEAAVQLAQSRSVKCKVSMVVAVPAESVASAAEMGGRMIGMLSKRDITAFVDVVVGLDTVKRLYFVVYVEGKRFRDGLLPNLKPALLDEIESALRTNAANKTKFEIEVNMHWINDRIESLYLESRIEGARHFHTFSADPKIRAWAADVHDKYVDRHNAFAEYRPLLKKIEQP